ncbi:hypothetical protein [Streptomyces sp. NBC_01669]|uniref:hypothetical protein n=1 Tax=Streptomyces sp. NBC_01669 TaxID=2975909 RepID=UPI00225AAAF3|nr:hypothetical protein [Streptomyces sp. NBC_01669]MCX4538346.1 hypothetical protein [Streptomyces sp. NBC_01669]
MIAEHFARETTAFEPRRLYTAREIAELAGISAGTIRADTSKWLRSSQGTAILARFRSQLSICQLVNVDEK